MGRLRSASWWLNRVAAPVVILVLATLVGFLPLSPVCLDDARYALSAIFQGMLALIGFEFVIFSFGYNRWRRELQRPIPRLQEGALAWLVDITPTFVDVCLTAVLAAGVSILALRALQGLSAQLLPRFVWWAALLALMAIVRAMLFLTHLVVATQEVRPRAPGLSLRLTPSVSGGEPSPGDTSWRVPDSGGGV